MYRITYEQGNGYHCNCCRSTWDNNVDLQTEQEVKDWMLDFEVGLLMPKYEDDDDREILSIEKEIGVDIKAQFKVPQADIDHEVANRKRALAEEERKLQEEKDKKDQEKKINKEELEKAKLIELAKKYPEILKGI